MQFHPAGNIIFRKLDSARHHPSSSFVCSSPRLQIWEQRPTCAHFTPAQLVPPAPRISPPSLWLCSQTEWPAYYKLYKVHHDLLQHLLWHQWSLPNFSWDIIRWFTAFFAGFFPSCALHNFSPRQLRLFFTAHQPETILISFLLEYSLGLFNQKEQKWQRTHFTPHIVTVKYSATQWQHFPTVYTEIPLPVLYTEIPLPVLPG